MMQTQKLSSLAFNLYDGDVLQSGKEPSRASHKLHAIRYWNFMLDLKITCYYYRRRPKLLPLLGYLLSFQNVMVGPFVFFSDYLCYVEGREEDQLTDETERDLVVCFICSIVKIPLK